jgi:ADP-heptose:LPS heptosyltransferase
MELMMTIDFMRALDKWVGIPACAVFSMVDYISQPFASKKTQPIKKILFIQISEMGSSISAYSSILKARELYPGVEIYYFIFQEMQDSIHLMGVIDPQKVFTVTSKSFIGLAKGLLKMVWIMRRQKFDAILDLELFSRMSSLIGYLFSARRRVGFNRFHMEGLYRGSLHTHRVLYNHVRHISHNFLSLVYALREDPTALPLSKVQIPESDIRSLKLQSSKDEKKAIFAKLRSHCPSITAKTKLILFNPNGSDLLPLRRWPMENYITTAKRLLNNKDFCVIITGAPSEIEGGNIICDAVQSERCVNFVGQTTLQELINLYNISNLLLSNDSGPPNFASLTNLHTLVFFGPETPICYKPLGKNIQALYANYHCSPCVSAYNHRKSACLDNKCLQAITVDEVYNRIIDLVKVK